MSSICQQCDKEYVYNSRTNSKSRCASCIVNSRRFAVKEKCLEYKGGQCEICGYNKCLRALSFHHRNPIEKHFDISGSHARSWDILKKELDKCDLLCMNCHCELHDKDTTTLKNNYQLYKNGKIPRKYKARGMNSNCPTCNSPKAVKAEMCKECRNKTYAINFIAEDVLMNEMKNLSNETIAAHFNVHKSTIIKLKYKYNNKLIN